MYGSFMSRTRRSTSVSGRKIRNDTTGGPAFTVDTHGGFSKADALGSGSENSHYVIVRVDVRQKLKVGVEFSHQRLLGEVKQQVDVKSRPMLTSYCPVATGCD